MAYGCANGYVRLLRPASGLVKTLGAHADKAAVTHVAVGGGGINVVVVSAAVDGTIKVGRNAMMVDFIYSTHKNLCVSCKADVSQMMRYFIHVQGPPASL